MYRPISSSIIIHRHYHHHHLSLFYVKIFLHTKGVRNEGFKPHIIEVSLTSPGPLVPTILRPTRWYVESWGREVRRGSGRSRFCEVWTSRSDPLCEDFLHARGSELGVQISQNRSLPDPLRTSRPHDSTYHLVGRRIVGTRSPEGVWETSNL